MSVQIYKHIEELIDFIPDLVVLFNSNGEVIDVSQKVLDFYNIEDKNYFIGKQISDFVVSEQLDELQKNFKELIKKGYIEKHDYKLLKADGSFFYGEFNSKAISNKTDEEQLFITIVRDLSQQKGLLRELDNSKQMFQLVLDNIPQYIFWKDIKSKYLGCNRNFARVAGVGAPENIVGKSDYDLAWKFEEAESFYEIERLVMESGIPEFHVIEPQLQADGKQAWLDVNRIPLCDSQGRIIGLLGTYEDITERKIAEEKLKESEEKFRTIFEAIPDLFFLISREGKILDYKTREIELYLQPEQFLNKKFKDILPESLAKSLVSAIKRTLDTKEPTILEYTLPIAKKNKFFEARILYFSENQVAIFIRDITAKKEAEEKLIELDNIRKELITRISHELRTPLTSVYGVSQFLLQKSPDRILYEEIRPYVEISHRGILRLKELVDNLLDASRLDIQKLELRFEEVNIINVLNDCAKELAYLAKSRNLTLHLDLPNEIYYNVDKNRISQVIINLVSNAIKNTPSGGDIYLKVEESDNFYDIIIEDTGVGITKEEKQRLFQKFGKIERYGQELDVDIEGAGLGLFISKEIIELHGGQILVDSKGRNRGAKFIIRFFK